METGRSAGAAVVGKLAGRGRRGGGWVEDSRVLRNVKILGVLLSAVTEAVDKDEVTVASKP